MYLNEIKEKRYDILSRKINVDDNFKQFVYSNTSFLDIDATNVCRLWHLKKDIYEIPSCLECGKKTNFTKKMGEDKGYNKYCSAHCRMRYTNLNRSEVEKIVRKTKIKETCIKKYGVNHYFTSEHIKNKKKETYLKKYGVENPSQIEWVKNKKKVTCLTNYGVENPSQSHEIQSKKTNSTRNKKIITECGKEYNIEGYETIALNELLMTYKPKDILHHKEIENEVGRIFYIYKDRKSVYHPDLFIKSENRIIEVKSRYWYEFSLDRNLSKKKFCEELGYIFEFWVYDYNGKNKIII